MSSMRRQRALVGVLEEAELVRARVVDEHSPARAPTPPPRPRHDRARIRHVHLERLAVDLRRHFPRRADVLVAHRDARALRREPPAGRGADPARPAGDERGPSLEPHRAQPTARRDAFTLGRAPQYIVGMALPPDHAPRLPSRWAEWVLRPIPFLERCRRRYGDFFTVRFVIGDDRLDREPACDQAGLHRQPGALHAGEANAPPLEPIMGKHSVLLLDGPEHMRQRKLMLPSFHGERMQGYTG